MKIRRLVKGELSFLIILGIVSIIALISSFRMFMDDQSLSSQGAFPLFCSSIMVIMLVIILFETRKCYTAFDDNIVVLEKFKTLLVSSSKIIS